jgi:hypothetical protein
MDSQQYIYSNKEGLPTGHDIHAGAGEKGWIVNRYISSNREGLPVGHGIHAGVGEKGWIVSGTFILTKKAFL